MKDYLKLLAALIIFIIPKHSQSQSPDNSLYATSVEPVIFQLDSKLNDRNDNLDFYYHDLFGMGHPVYIFDKGIQIQLSDPTFLFQANKKQLPFFIYPGEKINIRHAGTDSISFYIKEDEKRNNELNFFRNLVLNTGNIYYGFDLMPYHKKVNSIDSFHTLERKINDVKIQRMQILNASATGYHFTGTFKKIASISIQSTAFYDSLELDFQNLSLLLKLNLYKNLILKKVGTFQSIDFMTYQFYYRACEAITLMAVFGNPHYVIKDSADFVNSFNFCRKELTGFAKDFMLYWCISTAFREVISIPDEYIQIFNTECNNDAFKKSIAIKQNENKNILYPKGSNFLRSIDGERLIDIKTIISQNKGKVILLDFWASWCGPCRYEMTFSHKLEQKFKGKDAVFIYISMDEDAKEWIKSSTMEGLKNKNSFLLINADPSSFIKQYNIIGIPRYMLIGKDGKMISDDSSRPSDPELEDLLKRNL